MEISHGTRDGGPVVLLRVPSGGPEVTLDPTGWARLEEAGVTSVVAQAGPSGEHIVARSGKRQAAAARIVWGDDPPARITYANGDRRDLRRANLTAMARGAVKRRPSARRWQRPSAGDADAASEATGWAVLSPAEKATAIRAMLRQSYRQAWHAHRAWQVRQGSYPLAPLLSPRRPPGARR